LKKKKEEGKGGLATNHPSAKMGVATPFAGLGVTELPAWTMEWFDYPKGQKKELKRFDLWVQPRWWVRPSPKAKEQQKQKGGRRFGPWGWLTIPKGWTPFILFYFILFYFFSQRSHPSFSFSFFKKTFIIFNFLFYFINFKAFIFF
jgi:hypothetical protein